MDAFINSKTTDGVENDGFIYISFGTIARAGSLPVSYRQMFINAIEAFPKLKFVWRWDGPHPETYPKNLFLTEWVDQQDLLADKRIRGFMTQSGRPSSQEALFNEVPIITLPVLGGTESDKLHIKK